MMKLMPNLNPNGWDEMFSNEGVRESYRQVLQTLQSLNPEKLNDKHRQAYDFFMNQRITFTVYSDDNQGIERIFPFDIIPRIITQQDWNEVESGIKQRLKALNLFLEDIYNEQLIIKEGIIPASLITSCPHYIQEVHGIKVPHNIHVHIAGIDLIRGAKGEFYVLEDNNLSEARTLHNQFGRLKSSVEFTDYHHLTNQELEDLLNNTRTQLIQFSTDFSKLFFSYT
ncbi:circularly permuted type 2 ATP-grasp protein [Flavobacterium sp. GB2R13]|uniref:circularly permuted type 2 ATP-grasp protein n=1 Tax=Flavobacterium algoris TaxID=3398733 RepID=UPI003A8C54E7